MSGSNKAGGINAVIDPVCLVVTTTASLSPGDRWVDVVAATADYIVTLPSCSNCCGSTISIRCSAATAPYIVQIANLAGTKLHAFWATGQRANFTATETGWIVSYDETAKKVAKKALTAATTTAAGGVLSWKNPSGKRCIITRLILDVTTKSTGAATLDAGVDDLGDTTNDTLIDGLDVNAAAGVFSNYGSPGAHGLYQVALPAGYFVVVSASATVAGLVGTGIIEYVELS